LITETPAMNWTSFDAFLQMGGYGRYVWGSYLTCLALMAAEAWLARRRHERARAAATDPTHGDSA
jgi:heme exporter protein D